MERSLVLPREVLNSLSSRERRWLTLAAAMQTGRSAAFWHRWRRALGARAVLALLKDPPRIDGWAHVDQTDRTRPLLLLANHRSYVDFFVIAAVLLRRAQWVTALNFPVKGAYCYESWPGALLNAFGTGFAAFPPFFRRSDAGIFDAWALDLLILWCREGAGRVIGFHPEGTRYQTDNPWELLRAQPGVGRLLLESQAQALPVFVAGLENSWEAQKATRARGQPVRMRFGPPIDLTPFASAPRRLRTYVAVGAAVMDRIQALANEDRAVFSAGYPAKAI